MCVCCMAVRGAQRLPRRRGLGRCVSERSLTCRRVERAAHWQPDTVLARRLMRLCRGKRPRGARSPQLLVILLLALAMTQCVNCAAGHGTGIFSSSAAPCKIEQSAAIKQAFVEQELASQPHEGSGPSAHRIWCCPTEISTNTPPALQNSTKSSTKTAPKHHARLPMRHMQRLQLLIGAACAAP